MNRNTLYIVSTPIGNLKDITLRALEILKNVDLIACEDTRHSRPLLQHYGIEKPLMAFHEHNEKATTEKILTRLQSGESVAYISDAGTPLISDPGFSLVQAAQKASIPIVPIPGPSAVITALSVSGLPTDQFIFEGFLPPKGEVRVNRLKALLNESRTMIFYEAPHRILAFLKEINAVFGPNRKIVLARELTKLFETVKLGTAEEILKWVEKDPNQQRGEMVVLIAGNDPAENDDIESCDELLKLLLSELPLKKAAEIAAKISGKRKNLLYQRALNLKGSG